jgi:Cu(I)/Ag(I) efflux system membrane fusion protein
VTTGQEANGQTEILAGLQLGQRVVLSGQFLIDSEASLRGLDARLNAQDAGPGAKPSAAAPSADPSATPSADPTDAVYTTPAAVQALDGEMVTLDHPPIPALKWPQMVMDFKLPPAAQRPRDLAPGEQIEVEFRMQDGDVPQITRLQRDAPGAAR